MEFWTYLRTRNVGFSYNTIVMLPIVAVETSTTSQISNFCISVCVCVCGWGGGGIPVRAWQAIRQVAGSSPSPSHCLFFPSLFSRLYSSPFSLTLT